MKLIALASACAFSLAGFAASAQTRPPDRARQDTLGPGSRSFPTNTPYPGPQGQVCIAWCPGDLNPCDPPEFKRADGRCAFDD